MELALAGVASSHQQQWLAALAEAPAKLTRRIVGPILVLSVDLALSPESRCRLTCKSLPAATQEPRTAGVGLRSPSELHRRPLAACHCAQVIASAADRRERSAAAASVGLASPGVRSSGQHEVIQEQGVLLLRL